MSTTTKDAVVSVVVFLAIFAILAIGGMIWTGKIELK